MEMNFKTRQRIKAFFKNGKPCLILKLNFLSANGENEEFNTRFNAFYEELYRTYLSACESFSEACELSGCPIGFTVAAESKTAPVCEISVIRTHKLRLPTGEIKRLETIDIFDSETGLLKKTNRKKEKRKKPLNTKKTD